jgi:hypothetical protein
MRKMENAEKFHNSNHLERRKEVRHPCRINNIRWNKTGQLNASPGWLNDISNSGLSFYSENFAKPAIGEDIELTIGPEKEKILCKVVRVEKVNTERSIIGCRKDLADAIKNTIKPLHHLVVALKEPKQKNLIAKKLAESRTFSAIPK